MCWSLWTKEPLQRGQPAKQQRRRKMLQLRVKGLTFREIGERLGVSHQLVQQAIKRTGNNRLVPISCRGCKALITQMRTVMTKTCRHGVWNASPSIPRRRLANG